jgi:hypothetical protein
VEGSRGSRRATRSLACESSATGLTITESLDGPTAAHVPLPSIPEAALAP